MAPTPSSQATQSIPLPYRILMLYLDPLISLFGAYTDIFTPSFALSAYLPPTVAPYNPLYNFLQHQLAGGLLLCVVLHIFLLRRTRELWIWDPVQAGQLVWDVVMIVSQVYSLRQQGRLSSKGLRVEDLGAFAVTAGVGVVRVAFLARVGFQRGGMGKERRG